jgi:hypothetical protein
MQVAARERGGQLTLAGLGLAILIVPVAAFGGLWHPLYRASEVISFLALGLFFVGTLAWNFKVPHAVRRRR